MYLLLLSLATLLAVATSFPRPPLTEPGLPDLETVLADVDTLPQRPRVLGYGRTEFGPGWAPAAGCTVREAMLADAGATLHRCRVTAGVTRDPFTGEELDLRAGTEIDHLLPLAAAWDLGAHRWSAAQRQAFANDPLNLVATSRAANQRKSDLLPADWQPTDPRARCWYARRLAVVAATYDLPLPAADISSMRRTCRMDVVTRHWLGWSVDL